LRAGAWRLEQRHETPSVDFVICSFVGQAYADSMLDCLPHRLYTLLRQMLLLSAVLSFLAPQMSFAMTAGEGDGPCAVKSMCETMADTSHEPCDMDGDRVRHGGSSADCASMTCYCTMPYSISHMSLNSHVVIAASTPHQHVAGGGINPAILRKPPKYR